MKPMKIATLAMMDKKNIVVYSEGALGWFCSVIVECCVSIDEQLNPF